MTTTGINLDPQSLSVMVQEAILNSITQETRDRLLSDAIANLLVVPPKKTNSWDPQPVAPLEEAFAGAINSTAMTVIREMVENDPGVQEKLRELVTAPITEICNGNYDGLPDKIGEAIGTAVADWLRQRAR